MSVLSQNPAIIALEWSKVATALLVLPFLMALYHFLHREQHSGLTVVGITLGLLSMVFTMLANTVHPTLSHTLGQSYMETVTETERTILIGVINGWFSWIRGINQTASLLYQGCVGFVSLVLIRKGTWRFWGWLGLIGALHALTAKLPLGLEAPTNFIWTGIAYFLWPVGLGVNMIWGKEFRTEDTVP
jgi:hypothetical protein